MIATTLILLCIPAAVEVTIAPDQPIPFVYCDDPLILEIYSDTDVQITGNLKFSSSRSGERTEIAITPFQVYADSPYWYVIEEPPQARGYYTLEVNLVCNGEEYKKETRFCRIDRPASLQHIPLYAHCGGDSEACVLTAAKSVGIETIHFLASSEFLNALTDEASLLGLHLILSLSPQQLQQAPEYLAEVIEARCENIVRFEIDCRDIEQECASLMDAFRQTECPAGMALSVPDAKYFSQLMAQSPNLSPKHVSLTSAEWPDASEVHRIRYIAAQYGIEGLQVHVANPLWYPRSGQSAAAFLQHFFEYRSAGASHIGLNASVFADDMGVQEMLAFLNGLALHFSGQAYVGDCVVHSQVRAPLFRDGANWLAVIWSKKTGDSINLPVSGATNLELYDAFGNLLKLDTSNETTVKIDCGPVPVYLKGTGGALLGDAAANELNIQVRYFLAQGELVQNLPPTLVELVQKAASESGSSSGRLRFLELMSAIPGLEEQWHTRQVPKHIIVPAILLITEMAKTMAILEEDRGELFMDPLRDTLSRTEESQSLYLTGSAGTAKSRERGDWILSEVRRLVEEAELMEKAERKIEAGAIAALAEARGLCLKSAAQADVPQEAPEILPQPEIPAEIPEGEGPEGELVPEGESAAPEVEMEVQPELKPQPAPEKKKSVKEEKPEEKAESTVSTPEEGIHVVVAGDNPYDIARKYKIKLDDLLKWNQLTKKSTIHIGQKLIIRAAPEE